jgi:hypothetical protein
LNLEQTMLRLEANSLEHAVVRVGRAAKVVVMRRGGRILGPFFDHDESVLWMSEAWASPERFRRLLDQGEWNAGGERVWIAPEIQYHVRDRNDFWNTFEVPSAVDPGSYTLQQLSDRVVSLHIDLMLEAHNLGDGRKALSLERTIRPIPDPVALVGEADGLLHGVDYAGYEQRVALVELEDDGLVAESWVIDQLQPGGVLLIPTTSKVERTDYFEPLDGVLGETTGRGVRLTITGDRRYKVGYKALYLLGRMGYLTPAGDRSLLLVRNFPNDPSTPYCEEPPGAAGCSGHSVHVYNDGGGFGGFGEMECNGRTVGGRSGRSAATDVFQLWAYRGPEEKLAALAHVLLGMN